MFYLCLGIPSFVLYCWCYSIILWWRVNWPLVYLGLILASFLVFY